MTRIAKIEKIDLDKVPANQRVLQELLENLESRAWNRIPIVADGDQLRYIVHVSMIDKFIRRRAFNGDDIAQLTLEDLLADAEMAEMFESTFAVVKEDATVLDANEAMDSLDNCEDVFVTKAGSTEEPVIGWLTDHEIAEALDASLG
jgi:hypothetical protein